MRQEQDRFRPLDRGAATDPPGRWNRIDTSGVYYPNEDIRQERIQEVRFSLNQEDSKEEKQEVPHKTDVQKTDGFEPFVGKEPQEGQENNLFVNIYGGNYAQNMKLDRGGVERALKIAHLEGKAFLTTLAPSRSQSEAQGNELAAKRFLLFERKTQKVEEENPYKRVVSVPEGWRIEINDARIIDELTERKLSGKELQKAFVRKFNTILRRSLFECVIRERLSSIKDEGYGRKLTTTVTEGLGTSLAATAVAISRTPFTYTCLSVVIGMNLLTNYIVNSSTTGGKSSINHPLKNFMPPVEIDKVARTYVYLAGKGRRLVREVEKEG